MSLVRAGVLVTGTEVLTGRITDRNGPWISERLGERGVEVSQITVVGDRPEDLEASLRFLEAEGVDLIVTSGGLGPTADDLTGEIVARFAGRELVLDEEMEARIHAILEGFAKRMKFDPEALRDANRKQAMVPEGSIAIDPAGTAPGLVVPARDVVVIVLPGPPRELQAMWEQALATPPVAAILDRAEAFIETTIRMFGIPESSLAQTLREVEDGRRPLTARDHDLPAASARSSSTSAATRPTRSSTRRCSSGSARPTAGSSSPRTARRSTSRSPSCSRQDDRAGRVVHGRAAGGAADRAPGRLGLRARRRRRLLERGEDGPPRASRRS